MTGGGPAAGADRPGRDAAGPAKYLVLGSPVSHSLSPAMMNAAFRAAGIDAVYEAREIAPARWPAAMEDLFREGIAGANVTVPLKEGALAGAREATAVARSIGAANTLVRTGGGWRADNTDGPGFRAWVEEAGLADVARTETLVLGAGGSARAVVWALGELGAARIRIANRDPARAEALARGSASAVVTSEALDAARAPRGGLVVNCTSLGLTADDPPPVESPALEGAAALLDLVYPETALVRAAREKGVRAEDGLPMLVHQGRLAFERWTGRSPDREVMMRAVRAELARRSGRDEPPRPGA